MHARHLPPDFLSRLAKLEREWNVHTTSERAELCAFVARFPGLGEALNVPAQLIELALARFLKFETERILRELERDSPGALETEGL